MRTASDRQLHRSVTTSCQTAIQLPPLSSPRRGLPQKQKFGAVRRPSPVCGMHSSRGGYGHPSHRAWAAQRLRAPAYPQKSDGNVGQRPVIHRPQPSQTACALWNSVARVPQGARKHHKGRRQAVSASAGASCRYSDGGEKPCKFCFVACERNWTF